MINYNKATITKNSKITMPNNTDSGISIKSVATYNKHILLGVSENTFSLIKNNYDENYNITDSQNLITYSDKAVRFVGDLGEYFGFIPKSQEFKLKYANLKNHKSYDIVLDNSDDLTSSIINVIKNVDSCIMKCNCTHGKCFKLVGFFTRSNEINLIVQLSCIRKTKSRKIYIVSGEFFYKKMTISNKLSISGIYDLYSTAKHNCISKDDAKDMTFGGVSYNNNILYILTKSGCKGWLWKIKISVTLNYFNTTMEPFFNNDQTKLFLMENNPVGLTNMSNNELLVINNEYNCNKIPYIIITLS